jgi:hypothetical protein
MYIQPEVLSGLLRWQEGGMNYVGIGKLPDAVVLCQMPVLDLAFAVLLQETAATTKRCFIYIRLNGSRQPSYTSTAETITSM